MRIKGLVILSAFCIGIMLIILIFIRQDIETDGQPRKETAAISYLEPLPAAPQNLIRESTPASPAKSAITIISPPPIEPENTIILPAGFAADENIRSNSTSEDNRQPGITKAGKYPTKKEAQEMQSKGIVMY